MRRFGAQNSANTPIPEHRRGLGGHHYSEKDFSGLIKEFRPRGQQITLITTVTYHRFVIGHKNTKEELH